MVQAAASKLQADQSHRNQRVENDGGGCESCLPIKPSLVVQSTRGVHAQARCAPLSVRASGRSCVVNACTNGAFRTHGPGCVRECESTTAPACLFTLTRDCAVALALPLTIAVG
eukprot:6212488-Pleurochrysis_carterae.AAC.6